MGPPKFHATTHGMRLPVLDLIFNPAYWYLPMIPWYAPGSYKEYFRRWVCLRSLLMIGLISILAVTEFRFNWLEGVVGSYLVTTNGARPESGAIWDQGRQSESARQTLNEYMSQRQDVQREVRGASSLGQVLEGLGDDRGAMISAAHFIELYMKLPPALAHELVSPYILLGQLSTRKWQRAFFEQQDRQLAIYLLDDQNQVLHHITVGAELIDYIRQGEIAIHTGLHQLGDFAAHVYPADVFFSTLNALPADVRKGIVPSPEELLRISGRIVRVGISSQPMGDVTELGFEVEDLQGPKVILTQGRTQDVQRLLWILEYREDDAFGSRGVFP